MGERRCQTIRKSFFFLILPKKLRKKKRDDKLLEMLLSLVAVAVLVLDHAKLLILLIKHRCYLETYSNLRFVDRISSRRIKTVFNLCPPVASRTPTRKHEL